MFMFSKLNVYSAPIRVGRAPIRMLVFFPAWNFTKPTGSGPKKSVVVLSVARNGKPRSGMLYAPACK